MAGGRLVVLDLQGRDLKYYPLKEGLATLGSDPICDIWFLPPTVSAHHATVSVHTNQCVVHAVGTDPTLVNGTVVSVAALRHGDEISVGGRRLRWEYNDPLQKRVTPVVTMPTLARRPTGKRIARRRVTTGSAKLALVPTLRASAPALDWHSGNASYHTKQAALMLMTGHTPKPKETPRATPRRKRVSGTKRRTRQIQPTPRQRRAREGPHSISLLEIGPVSQRSEGSSRTERSNFLTSPILGSPKKSAMKDPTARKSTRKTESIKFDLSNLDGHERSSDLIMFDDTEKDDYSESSVTMSPSPKKNSRSSKILEKSLRSSNTINTLSPRHISSQRSTLEATAPTLGRSPKKSLRGGIILKKALENSRAAFRSRDSHQSYATAESPTASIIQTEVYTAADIVSLDSQIFESPPSIITSQSDRKTTNNKKRSGKPFFPATSTPYSRKAKGSPRDVESDKETSRNKNWGLSSVSDTSSTGKKPSLSIVSVRSEPNQTNVSDKSKNTTRRSASLTTPKSSYWSLSLNSTKATRASKSRSRINDSDLLLPDDDDDASPRSSRCRSGATPRNNIYIVAKSSSSDGAKDGCVTPENEHSPKDAGTPVLNIQNLLDQSLDRSIRVRNSRKRKAIGHKRSVKRPNVARAKSFTQTRSKKMDSSNDEDGIITPTSDVKLVPESVKNKHSTAKKPQSKRSLIDTLDESDIVKQLFSSPVKRNLSRSMSDFNWRDDEKPVTRHTIALTGRSLNTSGLSVLHDSAHIAPEVFVSPLGTPNVSPNISGVKRLFARTRNDLSDVRGVKGLLKTPRARRSIGNDLNRVSSVKKTFARSPKNLLSDVRVKEISVPSPKNDLRRVSEMKSLFQSVETRQMASPNVENIRGFFKRIPRNELVNVSGVTALKKRSPRNDLADVEGIDQLYEEPAAGDMSGVELLQEQEDADSTFDRLLGKPKLKSYGKSSRSSTFANDQSTLPIKKPSIAALSQSSKAELTRSRASLGRSKVEISMSRRSNESSTRKSQGNSSKRTSKGELSRSKAEKSRNSNVARAKSFTQTRSKKMDSSNDEDGIITPTSDVKLVPESVKNKHSTAKKPQSKRSLIDTLDESDIVKQLFSSPVKRNLSRSMSDFNWRDDEKPVTRHTIALTGRSLNTSGLSVLHDSAHIAPEVFVSPLGTPNVSPNISGVKRLFARTRNDLSDVRGVKGLLKTPRARRSIGNDLNRVSSVKKTFARSPKNLLSDVRVKEISVPSPKNDLRRVSEVKSLFQSVETRQMASPNVENIRGFFKRIPRNELVNVSGVTALKRRSPRNDLADVEGIDQLYEEPAAGDMSGVELLQEQEDADSTFDRLLGKPKLKSYGKSSRSSTFANDQSTLPIKKPSIAALSQSSKAELTRSRASLGRSKVEISMSRRSNESSTRKSQGNSSKRTSKGELSRSKAEKSRNSKAEASLSKSKRQSNETSQSKSEAPETLQSPIKQRVVVQFTPVKDVHATLNTTALARMSPIAAIDILTKTSMATFNEPKKPAGKSKRSLQKQLPEIVVAANNSPKKVEAKNKTRTPIQPPSTRRKAAEISKRLLQKQLPEIVVTANNSPKKVEAKNKTRTPIQPPTTRRKAAETKLSTVIKRRKSITITKKPPVLSPKPVKQVSEKPASPKRARSTRNKVEEKRKTPAKSRAKARRTSVVVSKPSPRHKPKSATPAKGTNRTRRTKVVEEPPKETQTRQSRKTKATENVSNASKKTKIEVEKSVEKQPAKSRTRKTQIVEEIPKETEVKTARPGRKTQEIKNIEEPSKRSRKTINSKVEDRSTSKKSPIKSPVKSAPNRSRRGQTNVTNVEVSKTSEEPKPRRGRKTETTTEIFEVRKGRKMRAIESVATETAPKRARIAKAEVVTEAKPVRGRKTAATEPKEEPKGRRSMKVPFVEETIEVTQKGRLSKTQSTSEDKNTSKKGGKQKAESPAPKGSTRNAMVEPSTGRGKKDQVIIPLSTTGLKSTQKSSEQEAEDDPLLVVHPNYVVDS